MKTPDPTPVSRFTVLRRNYGHWDFLGKERRLFRLRGGPGRWLAMDERERATPTREFRDQGTAFAYIIGELTWERLAVAEHPAYEMEAWNI